MTATLYPTRSHGTALTGARDADIDNRIDYTARRAGAVLVLLTAVALLSFGAFTVVAPVFADTDARASAADVAAAPVVRIHVAQPGDTIWSIAQQYRGDVGHARFVDALIDVNGGTAIQVGQAIRLP